MIAHLKVSKSVYFRWKLEMKLPNVSNWHKQEVEKHPDYFDWNRAKKNDFILYHV